MRTGVLWKVCGITDEAGAEAAARAGADALGFIFYPPSPRSTTPAVAERIAAMMPPETLRVGVFVDAPAGEVRSTRDRVRLDIVQLSGEESPELCERIGGAIWKAIRIPPSCSRPEAEALASPFAQWTLLVDAGGGGSYGGTGTLVDWDSAAALASRHRLVLAGGLRADNVAAAITRVGPWAVDVASGVETEPGRKCRDKLAAFAEALGPFRSQRGKPDETSAESRE